MNYISIQYLTACRLRAINGSAHDVIYQLEMVLKNEMPQFVLLFYEAQ
jgi:hypothetical protein